MLSRPSNRPIFPPLGSPLSSGNSGTLPIGSYISSCISDLDATIIDSYPGTGQPWFNYEPTPADGSTQAANDAMLGTTTTPNTTDPTFTGTAGSKGAYFLFDGGDSMRVWNNVNTTTMNNAPKTTGGSLPLTLALAFRMVSFGSTITTMGTTAGVSTFRIRVTGSNQISIQQGDSSTFVQSPGLTLTPGNDYLYIASMDASGNYFTTLNGVNSQGSAGALVTNTVNANTWSYGNALPAGYRLYSASMFNAALSADQREVLRVLYQSRHGRVYA